jgi:hypothetical protein
VFSGAAANVSTTRKEYTPTPHNPITRDHCGAGRCPNP